MSGVYIPDMEMPKSCYKCLMKKRDGMDMICAVLHERFSVADPKKIWVPSKEGLGMKTVFDMVNQIYGKDFYRYD